MCKTCEQNVDTNFIKNPINPFVIIRLYEYIICINIILHTFCIQKVYFIIINYQICTKKAKYSYFIWIQILSCVI